MISSEHKDGPHRGLGGRLCWRSERGLQRVRLHRDEGASHANPLNATQLAPRRTLVRRADLKIDLTGVSDRRIRLTTYSQLVRNAARTHGKGGFSQPALGTESRGRWRAVRLGGGTNEMSGVAS